MILKKSMISIAAASLLAVSFVGCGDTTSNSVSSGTVQLLKSPTGTVSGYVTSTNGTGLEGLSVSLLGNSVLTDSNGFYKFDDVVVSNVSGADAATTNNLLSVVIAPSTGYLGATVTVTPSAQIDSADGAGDTNGVETFIDGFNIEAGTAPLPALTASVTGKLEDATSQDAMASTSVSLDFVNTLAAGAQSNIAAGVAVSYATGNYTATTDAQGNFTFTNVPADSSLTYVSQNCSALLDLNGAGTPTVSTINETDTINVGDLQCTVIVNNDTVAPSVLSVNNIISQTAGTGMFTNTAIGATNPIVINFTENIANAANVTADSVKVYDKTNKTYVNVASATISGSTLTVTLANDLAAKTTFDINLVVNDFADAANNHLIAGAGVGYDTLLVTPVLELAVQTFAELNLNAAAVTNLTQLKTDENGEKDLSALQAVNNAFNDVQNSGVLLNQAISNTNAAEADARLQALGRVIDPVNAAAMTVNATGQEFRSSFTPTGAPQYSIALESATGAPIALVLADVAVQSAGTILTPAGVTIVGGVAYMTMADATNLADIEFLILNGKAAIKNVIKVTAIDDLGNTGTVTPLAVVDNVAPTTILQTSYAAGNAANVGNTVNKYGAGGELAVDTGAFTVGTPYLAITAGLLDNLDATGAALKPVAGVFSDNSLRWELIDLNTKDATTNTAYIANTTNTYDSNAWIAFNTDAKLGRSIGVEFSEDVNLTGTSVTTTGLSTTASNWTESNNVAYTDDALRPFGATVDMVNFTTSNVLTLANVDTLGVIDFTGIKDAAGNETTAASNAKVVIKDQMPPFVTKAYYNGIDVVMTFNEKVVLAAGDTFTVNPLGVARTAVIGALNADKFTLDAAGTTVTIKATEFPLLTKADFTGTAYAEAAYGTTTNTHAALYTTINDANGNDWLAQGSNIVTPFFAMAEMVGTFTQTSNNAGFIVTGNSTTNAETVVWTYSHPIRTTLVGNGSTTGDLFEVTHLDGGALQADGSSLITFAADAGATITAYFEAVVAGAASAITDGDAAAPTQITLSADKTVVTLRFTTTADIAATTDSVRQITGQTIFSAADTTQSWTGNAVTANAQP